MAFTKVTGTLVDIGDLDLTNVGQIQLDSIAGDADANTSITFSGSDVITIATGGAGRLTIGDGALSPVTDNQIDLGTSSLEFKDAFFDGTVTSDAFAGPLTGDVTGNVSGTAATVTGAAQSAITSLGTLTTLTVDDITINGSTISDASHLTIDAEGVIKLDANGGEIQFLDGGTEIGVISMGSQNINIESKQADKDIVFKGIDGASDVTALTLDMSAAGAATFNAGITATGATLSGNLMIMSNVVYASQVYVADRLGHLNDASTFIDFDTDTIKFATDGEAMRISSNGGLNIGTQSGASGGGIQTYVADNDEAVDCEGSGRVNFTINSDESGGNRWYFRTAGSGNFGSSNGDLLVLKEDGSQIMKWDLSSMTIVGDFDDTSDVALKENIIDITDATAKIKALQPRTFDWKDKNKTQGTNGFIAQEVETVLPKLVHGDNYDPENPHHGHKAINTSGLLAVAIKAIQELEARIETLEG